MDVSTLQVRVVSDGIAETSRKLSGLGTTAANTEKKVDSLTQRIQQLIGANSKLSSSSQSASAAAQSQAAAFVNLQTITAQIALQLMTMTTAITQLNAGLNTLSGISVRTGDAFRHKSKWGNVFTNTLKAMATAASTYAGINLVKSIVESADAWQNMSAKLEVVSKSQNNAGRAMEDIFEVAQRVRTPLESVTQLWTRMAAPMQRMGRTGEDTTRVVQSVATALQLSGATAAEASSAMLQLSQSFNAGRLNGAEFNSIAEAAPLILEAIASKMGKTREELKKLGSEGKITGKVMADALIEAGDKWDKLFDKLPVTVGGSITLLKNRWLKEIGEMGKDTQFNAEIVKGVRTLESMIPGIARALGKAFVEITKWLDVNRDKLGQIWDQVTGLLGDLWRIGTALASWVGKIIGAGDEVSVIAALIYGIRTGIAALTDATKILAAAFIRVGADIADYLTAPLAGAAKAVSWIVQGLEAAARMRGRMAGAVGNKQDEKAYAEIADALAGYSQKVEGFYSTVSTLGDKAREVASGLTAEIEAGGGALRDLMNEQKSFEAAQSKKKNPYDSMWGSGTPSKVVDEKAVKAAKKALDDFLESQDKLNQKLKEQKELGDRLEMFGLGYDKISEGTKQRIKLVEELTKLEAKSGTEEEQRRVRSLMFQAAELEYLEQENERTIEKLRLDKAEQDSATSKLKTLQEEAAQLRYKVETYGMVKGAVEALELATAQAQIDELSRLGPLTEGQAKLLNILKEQVKARKDIAASSLELGGLEAQTALDKLFDSNKAIKFGEDFKNAFGKVGKAIGGVADAFERMNQRQVKTIKMREEYNKTVAAGKADEKSLEKIRDQELKDSLDGYADMASAAKGFFDEKSKGYKTLEGIEKTFRLMEMAMELKSFATQISNTFALTQAKVAGNQTIAASAVASAGTQIAADQATSATGAVAGTINQAKGDPYTAFFRMAAMAAIMASLGYAVGGGFNKTGSAPVTNTGTGTVFGDSSAQSESIAKSIDLLSDIDEMTMRYSAQMAASLRNIEAALSGVTNLILRDQTGISSGRNFGIQTGLLNRNQGDPVLNGLGMSFLNDALLRLPVLGSLLRGLQGLWGKTEQEISGAGLMASGSLSDLRQGRGFSQYADVKTTRDSWFGLREDVSYSTLVQGLDEDLSRQFGLVFEQLSDAVTNAAVSLDMSSKWVESNLKDVFIDLGKIDLKGLTGEQIKERLSAVFGAAGDTLASAAIPGLEAFQKVGEGYFETLMRVSSGVEQANYELDRLGVAAIRYTDIVEKQGDVSAEIVRQSLLAVEAGSGIADIIEVLTSSASDISEAYTELIAVRRIMQGVGLGSDLSFEMIRAAGGLDSLRDALEAYTEGFFTEAEQNAMKVAALTEEFDRLGLNLPATRDEFKALVTSLNGSGNVDLATRVLLLAGAFNDLAESTEDVTAAAMEQVQGNLDAARDSLISTYEREAGALENVRDKFKELGNSLKDFRGSLLTGELSTLTGTEKMSELRNQFTQVASAALGGDESAISKFQSIAQEFLTFSRSFNASGSQYTSDFQRVLAVTEQLEQMANGRVSVAEQQLVEMKSQVEVLVDINENVITLSQAINTFLEAQQAAIDAGILVPRPTGQSGDSNAALIAEMTALRVEVIALREQQANETSAIIGANYDANAQNAQTVSDATMNAASVNAYVERTGAELV